MLKEINYETARDFVENLDPSNERWAENNWSSDWIFRGQADANWRLIPSAMRVEDEGMTNQWQITKNLVPEINPTTFLQDAYEYVKKYEKENIQKLLHQMYIEITNMRDFLDLANSANLSNVLPLPSQFHVFGTLFVKGYFALLDNPDVMERYWGTDIFAIAQHHGIATRLLDWTQNPLYAAYFACTAVPSKVTHIAVYAIRKFQLRHSDIHLIEVHKANSTYIHAQEGIFTLDTQADIHFLQTGTWRSVLDENLGTVYKITLPVSELSELKRILWLKRVTKAHLMPSLDNIAPALETKWKELHNNLSSNNS